MRQTFTSVAGSARSVLVMDRGRVRVGVVHVAGPSVQAPIFDRREADT